MKNTKTLGLKDTVVRRLYARGKWKLESAAHFGGEDTGIADMCLLRDDDDRPFIPAASIAGAARSFLARQSEPWRQYKKGNESPKLKRLFGGAEKDDTMSALIVLEATCVSEVVNKSIRDGVRVNTQSGSAADKAKFDVEVVERGTEFELNLECIVRCGDDQLELEELFLALLHGFQEGDLQLGARTRRGYGHGKVASWEIRDLQMNTPADVMAWLRDDVWSRPKSDLAPRPMKSDQRQYFRIEADFELRTSLLIRSSATKPEDPDMIHLQSANEPVVPGTSFAGAFRHRAALIAKTLDWLKPTEDVDTVCEMFGPVHKQDNETQERGVWASRVRIKEGLVQNVETRWQDRVAIDRFTGGSLAHALFNEKPIFPKQTTSSHLRLILALEEPDDAEIGLLLLTLRDFWHGYAALGGETSNGRGTLQGIKAQLQVKRSTSATPDVWKLLHKDNRMNLDEGDAAFLEYCIEKAQGYSDLPKGSRRPKKEKSHHDA